MSGQTLAEYERDDGNGTPATMMRSTSATGQAIDALLESVAAPFITPDRGSRIGEAVAVRGRPDRAGGRVRGAAEGDIARDAMSRSPGAVGHYEHRDFVQEIHRLTDQGVDAVFDSIGGTHIWRSRKALRPGGTVVAYGLTGSLRTGRSLRLPGGPLPCSLTLRR